jgi:environmental stress-induced protein Ves
MRFKVGSAAPVTMRRFDAPLRFAGETPAHCSLLGGPIRDVNLMVARDHARGEMALLRDRLDQKLRLAPGGTALLLVLARAVSVAFADQQAVTVPPGDAMQIHAREASIRLADGSEAVLGVIEPIPPVPPPRPV